MFVLFRAATRGQGDRGTRRHVKRATSCDYGVVVVAARTCVWDPHGAGGDLRRGDLKILHDFGGHGGAARGGRGMREEGTAHNNAAARGARRTLGARVVLEGLAETGLLVHSLEASAGSTALDDALSAELGGSLGALGEDDHFV
jgi:hypothetical protein